jgi:transposase
VLRFRLMIKRGLNETATSIRKVKRSMKYYAGLDVSVKETSVCIVDESGNICREKKVISHPDDLVAILSDAAFNFERIGLEAGPLSQWLFEGLAKAGFAVLCIETRHTKAFLKAQQPNKSDRNDARGIAHMMRVGLFKDVHVKTLTSQKRRALLTARKLLQEKAIAIENDMRGLLRNFGLKVGTIGAFKFDMSGYASSLKQLPIWRTSSSRCSLPDKGCARSSPNWTARSVVRPGSIRSAGS